MGLYKEKQISYCSNCGAGLIRVPIPAHKAFVWRYDFFDASLEPLGTKFNDKTGLRQFGIKIICPNKKWYNSCTKYIKEDSLHDSDLPEQLLI